MKTNKVWKNSERTLIFHKGEKFRLSDILEELDRAGLLPRQRQTNNSKKDRINVITRYEGQYKLCFIRGNFAYFTPKPLTGEDKQWGDDWDDAPYQHNAGLPYDRDKLVKLAFEFPDLQRKYDWFTPADKMETSVEAINLNKYYWVDFSMELYNNEHIDACSIIAGNSISEFINKVQNAGGNVYTEI